MNPIKLFKVWSLWENLQSISKENKPMKVKLPIVITLLCSLAATLGLPAILYSWVISHLGVYMVLVSAAIGLHALLPSIFGGPSEADKKATGLTGVGVLLFMLLMSGLATAQTAPAPTSNGFAATSDAVAIHFGGEWSAGTIVTESYDFLDFGAKKSNHLYLEGKELIAPSPGFNAYLGGITVEPDLSKLFQKTNVQPGSFSAFFSASLGNGIPSNGGSHITFLAGGGVKYRITDNLTWQSLRVDVGRFGTQNFSAISTGLNFIFAGKQ